MGNKKQSGFTMIEALIAMGIFAIIAFGIFSAYSNILDSTINSRLRRMAVAVAEEEVEIIRNLPYDDVGIVGGSPAGVIESEKDVDYQGVPFVVKAFVRNIDDPFDGVLGGDPNDTAPADYKLVTFRVTCPTCPRFNQEIDFTTIAAPRALENATNNGNLFINVFDANGLPIVDADVHVENNILSPTISIDDETNSSGVLQLVDVPPSIVGYEVTVSKNGYSSNRTYAADDFDPSTPVNLHSTVAMQAITEISFAIDLLSTMNITTNDQYCKSVANIDFDIGGTKLVATEPSIKKYSQSTTTQSIGAHSLSLEWDTYNITGSDPAYYFSGFTPQTATTTVDPNSSYNFDAIVDPRSGSGLLVTVKDSADSSLNDASVRLTGPSTDETFLTGRRQFIATDWSLGGYFSQDGGLDADSPAGEIHLIDTGGGAYSTSTESWLISLTKDFGTSTFHTISWTPETQPPTTGTDSLRFQIATNKNQSTWNFIGPDGTSNTYYTTSGGAISSSHNGDRYLRYRVHMETDDENLTPTLNDVTIDFTSVCTPSGQVFFNSLSAGSYNLEVQKGGYNTGSSTVIIGSDSWNHSEIILTTP